MRLFVSLSSSTHLDLFVASLAPPVAPQQEEKEYREGKIYVAPRNRSIFFVVFLVQRERERFGREVQRESLTHTLDPLFLI